MDKDVKGVFSGEIGLNVVTMFLYIKLFGDLSFFNESATLREGFTKASRRLRETFAERVFEEAS